MPSKLQLQEYTPLWRGFSECDKCDVIIMPIASPGLFMLPYDDSEEWVYIIRFNIDGVWHDAQYLGYLVDDTNEFVYANLKNLPAGLYTFLNGEEVVIDQKNKCITAAIWKQSAEDSETYQLVKNLQPFYFPDEEDLCRNFIEISYKLDCNQQLNFAIYLDAVLARQPLSLADELNAVSPAGLSRRIFSRTQQTKELRIRPLTLATHELLEYVLNLPSFEIDGTAYTQAEGEVYTYVDAGSSGYYVGRVALVSGGNVFRSCCEVIAPSS